MRPAGRTDSLAPTSQGETGERMNTALYVPRLMLYVYEAADESPSGVVFSETEFPHKRLGLTKPAMRWLWQHVEAAGWIERTDLESTLFRLTDRGLEETARMVALRGNTSARFRHTLDELLRWASENQYEARAQEKFMGDSGSYFLGEAVALDEIAAAEGFLVAQGLVMRVAPAGLLVTPDGIECIISGGSVRDYLARSTENRDTYIVNNVAGAVIGGRNNTITQSNAIGVPAEPLA